MQPLRLKKNIRFLLILIGVFAVGVPFGLLISSPILSIFFGSGGIAAIALLRDVFKDVSASGRKPFKDYSDVNTESRSLRQPNG